MAAASGSRNVDQQKKYTAIRNTHEVNRMIFDLNAPAFVIKDGVGMQAQCVRQQCIEPREHTAAITLGGTRPAPNSCMLTKSPPRRTRSGLKARASATMPSRRATSSEWEPV